MYKNVTADQVRAARADHTVQDMSRLAWLDTNYPDAGHELPAHQRLYYEDGYRERMLREVDPTTADFIGKAVLVYGASRYDDKAIQDAKKILDRVEKGESVTDRDGNPYTLARAKKEYNLAVKGGSKLLMEARDDNGALVASAPGTHKHYKEKRGELKQNLQTKRKKYRATSRTLKGELKRLLAQRAGLKESMQHGKKDSAHAHDTLAEDVARKRHEVGEAKTAYKENRQEIRKQLKALKRDYRDGSGKRRAFVRALAWSNTHPHVKEFDDYISQLPWWERSKVRRIANSTFYLRGQAGNLENVKIKRDLKPVLDENGRLVRRPVPALERFDFDRTDPDKKKLTPSEEIHLGVLNRIQRDLRKIPLHRMVKGTVTAGGRRAWDLSKRALHRIGQVSETVYLWPGRQFARTQQNFKPEQAIRTIESKRLEQEERMPGDRRKLRQEVEQLKEMSDRLVHKQEAGRASRRDYKEAVKLAKAYARSLKSRHPGLSATERAEAQKWFDEIAAGNYSYRPPDDYTNNTKRQRFRHRRR